MEKQKKQKIIVSDVALDKIVKSASNGDEMAFSQIVKIFQNEIYNMAMYITQNREDALDASQEVFIKLWRSLPGFRGECSIKSYIMKLTKNTSLDIVRKQSRNQSTSLTVENEKGDEVEIDIADDSEDSNPEKSYLRQEKIQKVRDAIGKLDIDQRQIIIMRDINGMSYCEIADTLGINEGTVKSRLNRARSELKKILLEGNYF